MSLAAHRRVLGWLEIATGVGIVTFWTTFFTIGLAPDSGLESYLAYEHSFVLPDLVLAATLIIAGRYLVRGEPRGRVLSLVGAGSLIFLGLVDGSFNAMNGGYTGKLADAVLNASMNGWCLIFGLALAIGLRRQIDSV